MARRKKDLLSYVAFTLLMIVVTNLMLFSFGLGLYVISDERTVILVPIVSLILTCLLVGYALYKSEWIEVRFK